MDYAQSQTLTDAQDLAALGRRHGMSTVHLRLAFARGLHPFYPPSLEVSNSQRQLASFTHAYAHVLDKILSISSHGPRVSVASAGTTIITCCEHVNAAAFQRISAKI